jgi:circadian clock protein KaiC
MTGKALIQRFATGVPGLDSILGGGLPEFSMSLIAGPPGSGKTTLAHQLLFALAGPKRRALFFTVLGEPPLKMLRYQQQFDFFDPAMIGDSVRFINLSEDLAVGGFSRLLARIRQEIAAFGPALVFVDSFRTILLEPGERAPAGLSPQQFLQQLGTLLSSGQITSFLIGENITAGEEHPILTVADGLISLSQRIDHNSMVRQVQVLKLRGQATSPGIHTFRIGAGGLTIFPAAALAIGAGAPPPHPECRLAMGVPGLDAMLGGGLPSGYSLLVAGPSGSGKTVLATAFLAEGARLGEPGVLVAFEQAPSQSWNRTLDGLVRAGSIGLINARMPDMSMDEIVQRLIDLIHSMKATRIVIDSLSGFELTIAPCFRADFRESLFRMISLLSSLGVTVLMTSELEDRYTDLRFSPYGSAFLTDAIIVQRYIELNSRLERIMAVVKVRDSAHSGDLRHYHIDADGIHIGERLGYDGLLSGQPTRTGAAPAGTP